MSKPADQRVIDLDGKGKRGQRVDKFYNQEIRCLNCGHGGTIRILKGLPVDQCPCPACLCQRLQPVLNKKSSNT